MPQRILINGVLQFVSLFIATILAVLFVGFLAWKVGAAPLVVIVALCLALMVYGLYSETYG